jgi:predicted O-methyltransferase YrrM
MGIKQELYCIPYLTKPLLWPEIGRRVRRWLYLRSPFYDKEKTLAERRRSKQAATEWCEYHGVPIEQALQSILGKHCPVLSPRQLFPSIFSAADERARRCPVRLGGPTNLDLLYTLCEAIQARVVIETGVSYGWSSLVILLSLQHRSPSYLLSVDLPYMKLRNDPWVGVVVPTEFHRKWKLYRMADREGLPKALRAAGRVDLTHYDSDKTYGGRTWAYPRIWDALRPCGILVSDDIEDNLGFHDFCQNLHINPVIVADGKKFQGVLVKPAHS